MTGVRALIAGTLLLVVALGGCAGSDDESSAGDDQAGRPAEPSPRVAVGSVTFEVPEDWRVFSGDEARAGAAAGAGLRPTDVGADVDAVAVGGDRDGVVERLLVDAATGAAAADVRARFEAAAMPPDARVERRSTALGEADVAAYPLPIGPTDLAGGAVLLEQPEGVLNVVVLTGSPDRTDAALEQVLASLRGS